MSSVSSPIPPGHRPLGPGSLVLAVLAVLAAGCAGSASLDFRCEPRINDGLLLTIDVVAVNEAEVQQIRQAGDQWFYSDLRRQLEPRTKTVAVAGGCAKVVQLEPRKGYDTLAVIADYKAGNADSARGSMQFLPKAQWQGKAMVVRVRGTLLTIEQGR